MKVFVSWSGKRSKAVAELLSDWVKCVIQATTPWISTRDIDRGALWFSEIGDQLQDTMVGVICLTQENKDRPWILFEAGALAKGLSSSRVCTFLIDLSPTDLEDPLAQFNHTMPDRESIRALVYTLNKALGGSRLEDKILDQVFDTYWPQFETKFNEALEANPSNEKIEPRSDESVLAEILTNTRQLTAKVRRLESRIDAESVDEAANLRSRDERLRRIEPWLLCSSLMTEDDGSKTFVIQTQETPSASDIQDLKWYLRTAIGPKTKLTIRGIPSE